MFFYKVEGHMPKLSSFGRGKTIRPKKSLTSLLHAALHLFLSLLYTGCAPDRDSRLNDEDGDDHHNADDLQNSLCSHPESC